MTSAMSAVSIAVSLIQSLLDYANSVCYGISARNLAKLQRIQNAAAHIVAHHQPKRPSSSRLFNLHWLPIKYRINFKIATLTYKTLATGQPGYLLNLLNTYQPVRSLCSQDNHLLAKPSVYTSIGRRAFSYAAPQIWNAIPLNIHNSSSVSSFKRNLKTHYFSAAF